MNYPFADEWKAANPSVSGVTETPLQHAERANRDLRRKLKEAHRLLGRQGDTIHRLRGELSLAKDGIRELVQSRTGFDHALIKELKQHVIEHNAENPAKPYVVKAYE